MNCGAFNDELFESKHSNYKCIFPAWGATVLSGSALLVFGKPLFQYFPDFPDLLRWCTLVRSELSRTSVRAFWPVRHTAPNYVTLFEGSLRSFLLLTCLLLIVLIFLPAFIPNKSKIRYFVVLESLASINLVGSTLFIPTIFFLWFVPKIATKYIWLVSSVFTKIVGIDTVFVQSEILQKNGKGIVILNHMTILDTLVGCVNIRHFGDWVPTVKAELKWWGTYGLALRTLNAIFINRTGKGAMTELSRAARSRFRERGKKTRLILFPEGTRNANVLNSKDGRLLPFKLGAFRLAVENRVPIFPVVVSKYYFCSWPYRFERGLIVAKALEPIYVDPKRDLTEQAEKTREIMEKEFITLSEQVQRFGEANQSSGLLPAVFCTICLVLIIWPILTVFAYVENLNCFDESFGDKYE